MSPVGGLPESIGCQELSGPQTLPWAVSPASRLCSPPHGQGLAAQVTAAPRAWETVPGVGGRKDRTNASRWGSFLVCCLPGGPPGDPAFPSSGCDPGGLNVFRGLLGSFFVRSVATSSRAAAVCQAWLSELQNGFLSLLFFLPLTNYYSVIPPLQRRKLSLREGLNVACGLG